MRSFLFAVAAGLAGCGGMDPGIAETENGGDGHMASEEPGALIRVVPSETAEFTSRWPDSTRIFVHGSGTEAVPVHMWCTTGGNDVSFTILPGQIRTFLWWCYGRKIHVHNLAAAGKDRQLIRVEVD